MTAVPLTINETLSWLSTLPSLMNNHGDDSLMNNHGGDSVALGIVSLSPTSPPVLLGRQLGVKDV